MSDHPRPALRPERSRAGDARARGLSGLSAAFFLVTWPQLVVGGGGIALLVAGIVYGVVVFGYGRRHQPAAAFAYAAVMFIGAFAGGVSLLVAAALRSHLWEVIGVMILIASYASRLVISRWLRRRCPTD